MAAMEALTTTVTTSSHRATEVPDIALLVFISISVQRFSQMRERVDMVFFLFLGMLTCPRTW
jgi:hypothetical protein